jgi:hypothetical protein
MGEDSSRLTLAQMQQYITDNNLPNKSNDTLTTGDIYDYVVEGLSAGAAFVNCGSVATTWYFSYFFYWFWNCRNSSKNQ